MPAFILKIRCEVNVGTTLDEQQSDIAKIKNFVDAVKNQTLTPDTLEVLTHASNLSVETKMVGRAAKLAPAPSGDPA
jgi:hypothetical protein